MGDKRNDPVVVQRLSDETLLTFLSDCHIGGDAGHDIFESPDDLVLLFDDLARHPGPVVLVLAGDFFDCLRISRVPAGENRVAVTISRPEYGALFSSLRRLATRNGVRVVFLPGNHDAEVWWNEKARQTLLDANLVHEFALSFAAAFESSPGKIVYAEHGNEFDASNVRRDYDDPYDTPLGDHIVTDIIPRLLRVRFGDVLQLGQINHVFPLETLPQWGASRLFYTLVTQAARLVILPLILAYLAFEAVSYLIGFGARAVNWLFVEAFYYIALLLIAFGVFFLVARRMANSAIRATAEHPDDTELIRERISAGEAFPLGGEVSRRLSVFVSGHTHDPDISVVAGPDGRDVVVVNSGCWLRQLRPVRAHFRAPEVFVGHFVQTHVRVLRRDGVMVAELWEHPRPAAQKLLVVEQLAVAGRIPPPPAACLPRVRQSVVVS